MNSVTPMFFSVGFSPAGCSMSIFHSLTCSEEHPEHCFKLHIIMYDGAEPLQENAADKNTKRQTLGPQCH